MPKAPDTGRPRTLRPGRFYAEADLAAAAAAALEREKVTQTAAAEALGLSKPHTVSMALALEPDREQPDGRPYVLRYPGRGFKTRRAILSKWGGFDFDGERPTHTPARLKPDPHPDALDG